MKIDPKTISKAVDISFSKFDHLRRGRGRFLAQLAGRFYSRQAVGDQEHRKASPMNLMYNAVTTLIPNLVYNDPRLRIATDILPYRTYADELQLAGNHLVQKIRLRQTLRKVILDAIMMAGFIKTGIGDNGEFITMDDEDVLVGQPYAERVDPDDMIMDPVARDWDEQRFIGNRFRVAEDDLLNSGLYDPDMIAKLPGTYDGNNNQSRDEAAGLMGDKSGQEFSGEVERYIDLVEIYLPKEQIVVTLPYQHNAVQDQFLRVADYTGPERGPYHMLGFTPISNNVLPVAPAGIWYDLHILGNRIARKMSRQAERMKRVLAYTDAAGEDVEQIAEADDGETVRVQDVNQIKEVQYGGTTNDSYNWVEWVKKEFSQQSGNIDLLNGTSTNSPTATQAEMLQANTSVRLADMQNSVYDFTAMVSGDLIYYLHTDPLIQLPLVKEQNGINPQTGMAERQPVQLSFEGGQQQGEWLDYNITVKPYSMARPDPNQQVRRKLEYASNVIPAAAQAAALLGPGFMIGPFLKRIAEETGIEDADEFINDDAFQQWMMMRMRMQTGDPGKAQGQLATPQLGAIQTNAGQPNPQAMGPTGGISPDQEGNMQAQEAAGQLQRGRVSQPSASALAQGIS